MFEGIIRVDITIKLNLLRDELIKQSWFYNRVWFALFFESLFKDLLLFPFIERLVYLLFNYICSIYLNFWNERIRKEKSRKFLRNVRFCEQTSAIYIQFSDELKTFAVHSTCTTVWSLFRLADADRNKKKRERETKTVLTRFQLSIEITFSPTFSTNTHRPPVCKKGSCTVSPTFKWKPATIAKIRYLPTATGDPILFPTERHPDI